MKHLLAIIPLWVCPSVYAQQVDSSMFFFKKGLDEKNTKRYLVASQSFEKSVKYNASNIDAWLENGLANLEMRKTDQAINCFQKALALDPGNKKAIRELTSLYFNYRQYAKAIEFARKCADCDNAQRIIGMSMYQQEDYPSAVTALQAALKQDPADAEATYTLARTYLDMEEYKKAVPVYEQAVKLDPTKNAWIYEQGLLYYNLDDYKNAMNAFNSAAQAGYVQSNDFNENLGYASLYSGEYEKGEKLLLAVLNKKPGNKTILRDMAEILYQQKQYDKSLDYCQKLLEIDTKDGKALYQAGLCFQKKGEKDRGQQMCDKAILMDPSLDGLRKKKEISGL